MSKRIIDFRIVVETSLGDDALGRLAAAFAQDCTMACGGRMVVVGGLVEPDVAAKLWGDLNLGETPAPGAVLWNPRERPT